MTVRRSVGDPTVKKILQDIDKNHPAFVLETPEQSVKVQLKIVDSLKPADNGGHFLSHPGNQA